MTKTYLAALGFGLLAALLMGMNSVVVRYLTADLHGLQIAVFRLWVACTAIYCLLKFTGHRITFFPSDRYQVLASCGFTLNYITFHVGLETTSATNAMVLENIAPIFVLVFLVVTGAERILRSDIAATLMALTGVYLTVHHDFEVASSSMVGDLWEIGAALSWAMFIFGSARSVGNTRTSMERMEVLFKILLPSAFLLAPALLLFPLNVSATDASLLLLLGLMSTALAYYLWYEAMTVVSTVTASLLAVTSVVFTFLLAYIVLSEPMTVEIVAGGALIVAGVLLPGLVQAYSKVR